VRATLATFRCEYAQTYGMTETSPFLTLGLLTEEQRALPPGEQLRRRALTGRPFAPVELRVVDDRGRLVPRDGATVGEIQARGDTVTPGYWNQPDETRAAFDGPWLRTGDLAVWDGEGFLAIVDRKKDVIATGGEKVYSIEVESALAAHPSVLEVAVYGVPDETWGELVEAAVVLRAGRAASADELVAHCRAHLSHYKAPRRVLVLDELPKTGSGKIAKRELRGVGDRRGGPGSPATQT
jgi:acyl-CoA synthetase (AMP-forming)/AMP-acid ligase II